MLRLALVAGLLSFAGAAQAEDCDHLTALRLDLATITAAQVVSASDAAPGVKPGYCRIEVTATPTADSNIRIELWVPAAADWNGKFEQVGNGGFAGSIPLRSMLQALSLGYAVAGTDDGHQTSEGTDASWALGHPEKIKDYGSRAIDVTAVLSKQIVSTLTTKPPSRSYFVGCSDGGREALMLAQRFPTYFDGIIAGAPFNSATRVLTGGAVRMPELRAADGRMGTPQLALLQRQALQSCGNGGSYLVDPRNCHADAAVLRCRGGATDDCLTDGQVKAAQILHSDHKDPGGAQPLYRFMPGAEAVKGSWDAWIDTNARGRAAGTGFVANYLTYLVMRDPKLDLTRVTNADLVRGERALAPLLDAENADLSEFKRHGGKLIQYHGWNDPAIPPGFSLEYGARVAAKTAGAKDFYRLYMVPGMLHCGGGDAPTQVNWQAAIENWVERAEAPGVLTASDPKGATQTLAPLY